ncbi:hypothetical protein [Vagococcus fessus]|uniref:hypothetical protein n=1 Tax=Vagococcus fessus TaxID=120370 RepID=UPI0039EA0827
MSDLTFAQFGKQANIPRTTVYTRLNRIKELDDKIYDSFITKNKDNSLVVKSEKVAELTDLMRSDNFDAFVSSFEASENTTNKIKSSNKDLESIGLLLESLKSEKKINELLLSEKVKQENRIEDLTLSIKLLQEKYDNLFSSYVKQSEHLQRNNDELTAITKAQQVLLVQEQSKQEEQLGTHSSLKETPKKGIFSQLFKK